MTSKAALPPWLPAFGKASLAIALLGGAGGGASYLSWRSEWQRPRAKVDMCFLGARRDLRQPEVETGTEPHDAGEGRTVYLTPAGDRAVRCAQQLGPAPAQRLAAALGELDPEVRAKMLNAIMEGIPRGAEGDQEAVSMGALVPAALEALPTSPFIEKARKDSIQNVACRFGLPQCNTAPPVPKTAYAGGAVAGLGLLSVVIHVGRAAAARVAAKRRLAATPSLSLLALGVALLGACAPTVTPREPGRETSAARAPSSAEPDDAAPSAPSSSAEPPTAPTASAPASASAPAPGAPTLPDREAKPSASCPGDMILVEGDYCTEVEHRCKKSWFDKSNKKEVCEEFEPKATCTGRKVKKRFCIDRFSWPNVRGERAEVMNNFYQAQVKCAAVGKRMCTESEWTMSCEGPQMKPFPYGWKRDATKCNGDHLWDDPRMTAVGKRDPKELARLWKGVPNGAQPDCVSDYGVPDLPGNTDDVVASETFSSDWKGKFDSVNTGGPWYKGTRNQCRPKIYTHDEGFYYYYLGFRCCGEADGVATDPRTPKQRKDGWKMSRVESLARFSVDEMKVKLDEKKRGACSCKDKDILCKTMCGTLLGPGAKDADLTAPRE